MLEMVNRGEYLLELLETKDTEKIQSAAESFSQAVDEAWLLFQKGEIHVQVRGKALPRTMHQFATEELPSTISDPQHWPAIARELRVFIKMVDVITA